MPSAERRRSSRRYAASLSGYDGSVGVDTFREIPQALVPEPAGYGDLAAADHEFQELGDVSVVGPAGGSPRDRTRVGQLPRRQRAGRGQPAQDVLAACVVCLYPVAPELLPAPERTLARPSRHLGAVEHDVLCRTDGCAKLDQFTLLQGALEVGRVVRGAQPTPCHQVSAGRHGSRRIDLKQCDAAHQFHELGRPLAMKPLRTNGDPPRITPGQLMGHHRREITSGTAVSALDAEAVVAGGIRIRSLKR